MGHEAAAWPYKQERLPAAPRRNGRREVASETAHALSGQSTLWLWRGTVLQARAAPASCCNLRPKAVAVLLSVHGCGPCNEPHSSPLRVVLTAAGSSGTGGSCQVAVQQGSCEPAQLKACDLHCAQTSATAASSASSHAGLTPQHGPAEPSNPPARPPATERALTCSGGLTAGEPGRGAAVGLRGERSFSRRAACGV